MAGHQASGLPALDRRQAVSGLAHNNRLSSVRAFTPSTERRARQRPRSRTRARQRPALKRLRSNRPGRLDPTRQRPALDRPGTPIDGLASGRRSKRRGFTASTERQARQRPSHDRRSNVRASRPRSIRSRPSQCDIRATLDRRAILSSQPPEIAAIPSNSHHFQKYLCKY